MSLCALSRSLILHSLLAATNLKSVHFSCLKEEITSFPTPKFSGGTYKIQLQQNLMNIEKLCAGTA